MKKLLFASAALMAFAIPAAPALAADGAPYIGIEGGLMKARPSDYDRSTAAGYFDYLDVKHKLGYDVDAIVGYDFGMFRLEAEGAYKRAKHRDYIIDVNAPGPFPGGVVAGGRYDGNGRTSVTSLMLNGLVDLGVDAGTSFYAGGGIGYARVSQTIESLGTQNLHFKDSHLAYQGIVGVRTAITPNLDAGLKYRYFSAGKLKDDLFGALAPAGYTGARTYVHSHSVLASLIYNFTAAPPPPPPPAVVETPPPPPPPPGHADLPGRLGDPRHRYLPGAAAASAPAAAGEG